MPPSQLKRLKTSLRDQGITGPQKSKKQKKTAAQSKNGSDRVHRQAALQNIRDSFNPFELRAVSARPAKFASVSLADSRPKYKHVLHRPGISKSAGEEMRRRMLLPEMQRRNKVGGLVDRRIGEGDPGMTAEDRAVQRFAREKEGRNGGASLFDLEASDDDKPKLGLTHLGRGLDEDGLHDDVVGEDESDNEDDFLRRKRRRSDEEEDEDEQEEAMPERKKTKKEVMEEVIAKSKLHKYERQKAKEDDEDLREELDKELPDLLSLLRGHKPPPPPAKTAEPTANGDGPTVNPERQKLLDGMDRATADKQYEVRLRELAQEARAKPAGRSKTAEEKAAEEAARLQKLEESRQRRMRGEEGEDDEEMANGDGTGLADEIVYDEVVDEAADFGLAQSVPMAEDAPEATVVHEDEDEFDYYEDLVASDSESEASQPDVDAEAGLQVEIEGHGNEEDEFVTGTLGDTNGFDPASGSGSNNVALGSVSYTYSCPRTHSQLLDVIKDTPLEQLPTIIQRIRAVHHPSLSATNKDAMADFSTALVDHVSYMGARQEPLSVIEQVIRHLHSLSRTYPTQIADAFRSHLKGLQASGNPTAGDLVILTAIGAIYPTSDHFHQVVTPAITLVARWLGLNSPDTEVKRSTGSYLVALCISYQKLSKRFIPEALRFTIRALGQQLSDKHSAHIDNLLAMADLWKEKSAFPELFAPALPLLEQRQATKALHHLRILLSSSHLHRRPLTLHTHKPLPIRSSIPKFEESFNPDKHYDPDRERSEASKLRNEYKREKKGAVRELRKDANFVAREMLRGKREKDAEHERKERRLIAEIQGEEGRENREYEREKRRRKAGRK